MFKIFIIIFIFSAHAICGKKNNKVCRSTFATQRPSKSVTVPIHELKYHEHGDGTITLVFDYQSSTSLTQAQKEALKLAAYKYLAHGEINIHVTTHNDPKKNKKEARRILSTIFQRAFSETNRTRAASTSPQKSEKRKKRMEKKWHHKKGKGK